MCSKTGGMKDYITKKVGLLISGENEKELSKALLQIINNKQEYNKEVLSNFAKDNFAQEKILSKLIDTYNKAIK